MVSVLVIYLFGWIIIEYIEYFHNCVVNRHLINRPHFYLIRKRHRWIRSRHRWWGGIFALRTHRWGGINKETFHTGTLQWPALYCGSLVSKTPCEMRWCLWNMRRSLLLGGSIEWLWLLSRQILLLMHQWCSVLWPTPMRPDGFYSHCMYSCVYQYYRL